MAETSNRPWRVEVDASACIGSGMCAGIAPDHFRLDGRISRPMRSHVDDDLVLEASENCPVEAILVHDERTGTVLAPREH
ncbi:ferredoxin [Actinomadura spongiicola]|uniref:Ferredoxin n=1 Tax=Actinomadura spongiicola TaxID=2303421 RepID=A0A372GGC2_9ACTN|nr:ferredoxin [Actinomadura spongiicola]RFS84427.1 ferredoxin [Actinomadura spongiicola]